MVIQQIVIRMVIQIVQQNDSIILCVAGSNFNLEFIKKWLFSGATAYLYKVTFMVRKMKAL